MDALDIPGYREALAREAAAREESFLDAPELVCGVEILPLTIRRLLRLQAAESVMLLRAPLAESPDTALDVTLFLWAMSPDYERALRMRNWFEVGSRALGALVFRVLRRRFLRRLCRIKLGDGSAACRRWVEAQFEAAPGESAPTARAMYGWPASYVGLLCEEYGWRESDVLDLPLRRLWQHVRRLVSKRSPESVMFNPSDRVRGRWLAEQNGRAANG